MFFFFKQKTAYELRISDWSSDVCSSDLPGFDLGGRAACLHQSSRARIAVGLFGGELVHTARFLAGEEARIDRMMIADPAPAALARIAAAFDRFAGPHAFGAAGPRALGGVAPGRRPSPRARPPPGGDSRSERPIDST